MNAKTIPGLLAVRVEKSPEAVAHWTMDAAGKWTPTTWREYWGNAARLAAGLQELGLEECMKVGIMAHTSQIWEFMQMAVLMSGGVVVGIDPHDRSENIHQIASCSHLAGMIVEGPDLLSKMTEEVRRKLNFVVSLSGAVTGQGGGKTSTLQDLYGNGSIKEQDVRDAVDRLAACPATIIFTSGTTGAPKGIMYTHEQVILACTSILEAFDDIKAESNLVCWLPLSNLFQRMVNLCGISRGAATYFVENPREVVKHLPSINPHVFIGVPRFFEKLRQGIIDGVKQKPTWVQSTIELGIKIGDKRARALREQKTPDLPTRICHGIVEPLLLKRLRGILGENLKYMVSGSAPMPQWLLEWFHALGVVILEAYGISENIIPIAANRLSQFKFGSVGKTLSGNEVVIAEDGELLVKGKGVFSGYYGDDSKQEALLSDGYLATGDYAKVDEKGFLSLVGRKSDIFKTSTGRRIAPVAIENCLLKIPYVESAVVFGAGKKFLIAILSVSLPALRESCSEYSPAISEEKFDIPEELYERIRMDVLRETAPLPQYQRPVGLLLTPEAFTVDAGELTSNLKVRRKNIELKYREYIDKMYALLEESKEPADMVMISL
jgi:long-chain acyl-CoA synthetase